MRVVIAAVGRMRRGAEADLVTRYLDRAKKTGRAVGLTGFEVAEIDEARAATAKERRRREAEKVQALLPENSVIVALDETGEALDSMAFSALIGRRRDDGCQVCAFVVGGPDGHAPDLRSRADLVLSLGAMTLPHQLARVVLAEQLYRVATILSGHPYHRG